MIKTLGTNQLQMMANNLARVWEEEKQTANLSAKSLYRLIGLKKNIVEESNKITEMVRLIAEQAGAVTNENGGLQIPDDKVEEVNLKLTDFAKETIDLEYEEIVIKEGDSISPTLMDILFDFIKVE